MFWAYNLKHFFKLNIKIDAGENIPKSGKKNMLYDNKDRMIQILVYGTGVNKTFWVKIFGNYNAQHEHSQHKLLQGQKGKKERKRTLLSFFFNLIFLFVATRVALIPRDRFCGIAVRWSYKIIPADKVNFFCANNALQILSFSELTLEFSKPLRYFSQRTTERCISKPRFFFSFFLFFCLVFHCLCSTSSKTTRIVQHWEAVMFRPAPMRKWQHFRAQKSWHDTTLSRKPFFCFSSLRAKQARRRWFGVNEQTIVFRRG